MSWPSTPLLRVAIYSIVLLIIAANVWAGLHVRRWAWDATEPVRFQGDIRNGFHWGSRAATDGLGPTYDALVAAHGDSARYGLDYTPARLLVMTTWARWLRQQDPPVTTWQNTYEHTWPLLYFNIAVQLASLPAMFLLVHHWTRRRQPLTASRHPPSSRDSAKPQAALTEGVTMLLPVVATLLLWWNPAVIWNAHCWPQWDIWCVPFFLWALLLASWRWWMAAGIAIAAGAMFKGQVLLVAPIFLLWPVLRGHWAAAGRFVVGVALGAGAIVSPWLIPHAGAWVWLTVLGVAGLALLLFIARRLRWRRWATATLAMTWLTAAMWITAVAHDGSMAWYHVGFKGPQENHRALVMGPVSNLAGHLARRHNWKLYDAVDLPFTTWSPAMRTLLIAAYALPLLACGVAASRFDSHGDRRFLLAAIAPWVFMFALMPQMHERYLLWAAACTAAWVCLGLGPLLIHLFITALAWAMMAHAMLNSNRDWARPWHRFLEGIHPSMAWALLTVAAALLVMMVSRNRTPTHAPPASAPHQSPHGNPSPLQ